MTRDADRRRLAYLKYMQRRFSDEMAEIQARLMRVTETGKRSRKVVPACGSESAYQRHRYYGEPQDEECQDAHRIYNKAGELRRHRAAQREAS